METSEKMHISIIGTGYIGSVTGACLAEMGHDIVFVGRDGKKINQIKSGKSPIFEPGLEELLTKNTQRIEVTTDIGEAVRKTDITFICVGTPPRKDGSSDLNQIETVSHKIGKALRSASGFHTIVTKSTVLPGTIETLIIPILEEESGKKPGTDFGIASNPEFLKEGTAVEDFFKTDRIVIGTSDERTRLLLETLYHPLQVPVFSTTLRTSEMIKFVSNAFLATKISFANEIGNLCKEQGIDSYAVFEGVGLDTRINPKFFRTGIGFGGSCFPKDVKALIVHSKRNGLNPRILKSVMEINEDQPKRMIYLLKKHLDPKGHTIGVLGLAFKPNTDDIRESRAKSIIDMLLNEGANIIAYDPVAKENFRKEYPDLHYTSSAKEVLSADAVLIVTEWNEFEILDYHGKLVIDGRRIEKARIEAAIYEGVCW